MNLCDLFRTPDSGEITARRMRLHGRPPRRRRPRKRDIAPRSARNTPAAAPGKKPSRARGYQQHELSEEALKGLLVNLDDDL